MRSKLRNGDLEEITKMLFGMSVGQQFTVESNGQSRSFTLVQIQSTEKLNIQAGPELLHAGHISMN